MFRRRYILSLLLLFVLLNLAVRYPLDHAYPHGSDTLAILQLSDSLREDGRAEWILTPYSYFGLYPLSYPSGIVFLSGEFVETTGINQNSTPWVLDAFFSILLLFAGFMLFRAFRMSDEIAVVFAGLMALSPFLLYFTYGQASTRGLLIPVFVLGLFFTFWQMDALWKRVALFSVFTVLAFTIHRTALVVLLIEGASWAVLLLIPAIYGRSHRTRAVFYTSVAAFGLFVIVWPFVPGLNQIYMEIPEVSSSFQLGEVEFRTGFFLEGDSPFVLLVNLGSNYVGSTGLTLLLLPLVIPALYPRSAESRVRDMFLVLILVFFAFLVWKVQYVQLLITPFLYLAIGLSVDRTRHIIQMLKPVVMRIRLMGVASRMWRLSRWRPAILAIFIVASVAFSIGMLAQRGVLIEPNVNQYNWPKDATVNTGAYIGDIDCDESHYFVSNTGLLDRRIRWFSGWDSVVTDPVVLKADGYLSAERSDFSLSSEMHGDVLAFLVSFYKLDRIYQLNSSVEDYRLYQLSMNDPYGLLRLYFEDETYAWSAPHISSTEARIGLVVQSIDLGDRIRNPFTYEGTIECGFLTEVSEKSYCICMDEEYKVYLAATQVV